MTHDDSTLPLENPFGPNYFASQFYLNEYGGRRYAELVGFQRALALRDAEAAARLGADFRSIVEYISGRTTIEIEVGHGVTLPVPSSTVIAGDDGNFGCFTFWRYTPTRASSDPKPDRLRYIDGERIFKDWRSGRLATPQQADQQAFEWAYAYGGALIYCGPTSVEDWQSWKTFDRRWWSSHT